MSDALEAVIKGLALGTGIGVSLCVIAWVGYGEEMARFLRRKADIFESLDRRHQ